MVLEKYIMSFSNEKEKEITILIVKRLRRISSSSTSSSCKLNN